MKENACSGLNGEFVNQRQHHQMHYEIKHYQVVKAVAQRAHGPGYLVFFFFLTIYIWNLNALQEMLQFFVPQEAKKLYYKKLRQKMKIITNYPSQFRPSNLIGQEAFQC
ncbi:unnamed protein product [Arctogadus glacialis]